MRLKSGQQAAPVVGQERTFGRPPSGKPMPPDKPEPPGFDNVDGKGSPGVSMPKDHPRQQRDNSSTQTAVRGLDQQRICS